MIASFPRCPPSMKILILASNPRNDLNLDREIRDLKEVIKKSGNSREFEIEDALAVRVGDLQDLLFSHRPQIVHFCGHGSDQQGLVFEGNEDGEQQCVGAEALSDLFRLFAENVGCVLLNACYSEKQANAIVNHIDYVIGMNQEIRDEAAIAFSKGFYRALGYECSIEQAYEFGKNAIQLEISGSSKMRSVATEEIVRKAKVAGAIEQTTIPEHLKPILKTKLTRTTSSSANVTASEQPLLPETRDAIRLDIDKSLEVDVKAKEYRDRVREFLRDRTLSPLETIRLKQLRENLELSEAEAEQILAAEQEPIRQSQDDYTEILIGLIEAGHYPFNAVMQAELQAVQQELKLTDEEIEVILTQILEPVEDYQARLFQKQQQAYEQKSQRYRQAFSQAINAEYPITFPTRDKLRSIQQSLALSDEEIAQIEQPIRAPLQAKYLQRLADEQGKRETAEQDDKDVTRIEEPLLILKEVEYQRQQEEQRQIEERQREETERGVRGLVRADENSSSRAQSLARLQHFDFDVITVDEKGNEDSRIRQSAEFFEVDLGNGVLLEMVKIPAGTFLMGSPEGQGDDSERPQHSVTLRSFAMGKYAVTQAQWRAVAALPPVKRELNLDPSSFKGDTRPVEQVSWYDAVEFCDRLSQQMQTDYRLPSEAEWEYACRAGTTTEFYFGQTLTPKLARCKANVGIALLTVFSGETVPVGSYLPNAFGLYDMHGNVEEWCGDHWHRNYQDAPVDGSAWLKDGGHSHRLRRGGSWNVNPGICRSAYRNDFTPDYRFDQFGFRVSCSAPRT